jgi:hypothetical protein
MADQVTQQQIEGWVASGNYHAALQALGRPAFHPGDEIVVRVGPDANALRTLREVGRRLQGRTT